MVGSILLFVTVLGLIGYSGEDRTEIPVVPCSTDPLNPTTCYAGMTQQDLEVPSQFSVLTIDIEMRWAQGESTWVGVIPASDATQCPPDEDGLTSCEASDLHFIAGGPESEQGVFSWRLDPGEYRLGTGSTSSEANPIAGNIVEYEFSARLNGFVALFTFLLGSVMLAAGIQL